MGDAGCCDGCEAENGDSMTGSLTRDELNVKCFLHGDDVALKWAKYFVHCNAGNKCYLLRVVKMAVLIVLKYGRRLDP